MDSSQAPVPGPLTQSVSTLSSLSPGTSASTSRGQLSPPNSRSLRSKGAIDVVAAGTAIPNRGSHKMKDTRPLSAALDKRTNRTTKGIQKLTLFPEEVKPDLLSAHNLANDDKVPQEADLYHQLAQTPPERLSKLDRQKLPRVTAFCTAEAYQFKEMERLLLDFTKEREIGRPKRVDECLFVSLPSAVVNDDIFGAVIPRPGASVRPESPTKSRKNPTYEAPDLAFDDILSREPLTAASENESEGEGSSLLKSQVSTWYPSTPTAVRIPGDASARSSTATQSTHQAKRHSAHLCAYMPVGHLFIFDYGVVVMWGFRHHHEHRILNLISKFETHPYMQSLVETEEFAFHYNETYQARIYDDIITLRNERNWMTKLTISHAIAQSTKLALYENLVDKTIVSTAHIPKQMAISGNVNLRRSAITKKIGQLFTMRIEVNLVSNVLDTPDIFWSEPRLGPLYEAIRGYLEIGNRVEVLNQRVNVISDLLDMLNQHLTSSHGERLEWVVIILIGIEIVIGVITIIMETYGKISHGP